VKLPVKTDELHKYRFVCPTCHNNFYRKISDSEPKAYFVRSVLCVSPCPTLSSFSQGLYNTLVTDGKEVDLKASVKAFPNQPADVPGVFQLTFSAKVSPSFDDRGLKIHIVQLWHAQFIILHFVYHTIDTAGSPAKAVYQHLRGFFKKPNALLYREIRFNVPDKPTIAAQADDMMLLANELMK
jgi:hypothetical protein